ncbi:MAG: energy transducer TonB [Deltaproteobacteria bacterium]|nr:energy transducer TonB [Deltaproteobacteria bacterium]
MAASGFTLKKGGYGATGMALSLLLHLVVIAFLVLAAQYSALPVLPEIILVDVIVPNNISEGRGEAAGKSEAARQIEEPTQPLLQKEKPLPKEKQRPPKEIPRPKAAEPASTAPEAQAPPAPAANEGIGRAQLSGSNTGPAPASGLPGTPGASAGVVKPVYPVLSRRLGEEGKVILSVLVGPGGKPLQAQVQHSSGYKRLDKAAVDAAMLSKFPVESAATGGYEVPLTFNFQLNE